MISKMTIPSRPAPAPPKSGNSNSSMAQWNTNNRFQMPSMTNNKKVPPPRPPPPKMAGSNSTAPRQPPKQSINILSNLFSKKTVNKANCTETTSLKKSQEIKVPPKIPAPPNTLLLLHQNLQPRQTSDVQLISFADSPSISPTMTQVSNSDCVSVDSFSSDSNYSPHNGGMSSQAESGFEDDFSVADFKIPPPISSHRKPTVNLLEDPFDMDPFSAPPQQNCQFPSNIRNVKQVNQVKPVNVGNASFYASTNTFASSTSSLSALSNTNDNPLCNGKSLLPTPSPLAMPTIIKPPSSKGKISPSPVLFSAHKKQAPAAPTPTIPTDNKFEVNFNSDESFDDDTSLPSPPMPNIPPPPLPQEFLSNSAVGYMKSGLDEEKESYGIALYDFESEHDEDLNLKANEKIYLIKQMNAEWYLGRNKRGCEGIFPISYIEVKKPLSNQTSSESRSSSCNTKSNKQDSSNKLSHTVRILYNFDAEALEDLTLRENEEVTVLYQMNAEWLYGAIGDRYGQFPANFIEYVPDNLPKMPST